MNDFDWDAHQKKLIAQGARHKKKPKKGCTLPSDYLTPAQKRKLNSEVTTVALNKPMTWEELNALPKDIQKEYINGLREKYHVGDEMVGKMLGVSKDTMVYKRHSLGGEWAYIPTRMSDKDIKTRNDLWDEFLGKEPLAEVIERMAEEPKPEPKKLAIHTEIDVTIAGAEDWDEVLEALKVYPTPKDMIVTIHIREGHVNVSSC